MTTFAQKREPPLRIRQPPVSHDQDTAIFRARLGRGQRFVELADIDSGDAAKHREELGDLLVIFSDGTVQGPQLSGQHLNGQPVGYDDRGVLGQRLGAGDAGSP